MKLICDKTQLLDAVNIVSKAASSNSTMKALECILIDAQENIKLTCNNLELGIDCEIFGNIMVKGSIAVDAKMFGEIIRRLPGDEVYIELMENLTINIKSADADFDVMGKTVDDFPELPPIETGLILTIPRKTLISLIKQSIFAISQNESKPILTGVKFEIGEGKINAIAVDGYRLAFKTEIVDDSGVCTNCVIPGKSLNELLKILKDSDNPIEICITGKQAMFKFDDYRFITRLLEGEFINYKSILANENNINVRAKTQDLLRSIERAALFADDGEGGKTPIKMSFSENKLVVSCIANKGKVIDNVAVHTDVENFEIGFNHRFILDALRATDEDDILMQFSSNINPSVIKPVDSDKFIFIVLPVRLRS